MNTLSLTKMSLVALGLLFVAGANIAIAAPKQTAANSYECLTDDGYGRKRSCSASYQQKRVEKSFDCFTDDGYGRKRPCSANIKR